MIGFYLVEMAVIARLASALADTPRLKTGLSPEVNFENGYTVNLKAGSIAFEVKDNKINISKKYATKVLSSDIVRSTIFDNAVYTFNGGEYVNSFSLEN